MNPDPTGGAPQSTALRLTGVDVLDLLHRISTQSLSDLAAGEARATLFCDFRARLLHRAIVARLADDSVWLLRDDASGPTLAAHIDRHVFREDVTLEDRSAELAVVGRLDAAAPAPGRVIEEQREPRRVGLAPGIALELVSAGAATPAADAVRAWELARIEAGRPRHGHEITEAFHPYEVGLWDEVHLSKGCYTGQEVLQRLVTYDSVRRRLARVSGPGPVPSTPVPACVREERVGTITSAIVDGAGWTGLAVLAKAAFEAGASVSVEDGPTIAAVSAFPPGRARGLPDPAPQEF